MRHAMRSLKEAMRWDEEVFGREYDLDIYMIVAVDSFNMARWRTRPHIFNSKYVLARPETATDGDYLGIQGSSPTSTSTTGPATASPAATGFS